MGKSKKTKHDKFIDRRIKQLSKMASDGFNEHGKGVLVVDKIAGMTEFGSVYIPKDEFLQQMEKTGSIEHFSTPLDEYDPDTEFAFVLHLKHGAKFCILEKE